MDPLATWEKLLIGVIGLLVLLWFSPGVKIMIGQSRNAQKNWPAVLIPAVVVVIFVILLLKLVGQPLYTISLHAEPSVI